MLRIKFISIFTILVLFIGLFFFASIRNVLAQELEVEDAEGADEDIIAEDLGVAEPRILPDNPFYFAKNFWRGVRTTFTFNPVKKAELRLRFANERLIEAKKLAQKTGKEEIFGKTLDKYQKDMERIQTRVEKFKEKAADNPRIDKFLDKFTDRTIKQQRLMDRLEKNLADKPEVLERIQNAKKRALEHFGEVMNRLEKKDKIAERLEKNLKNIEGSKYKNFKNLEVLMRLEEKVPEQAKEAIEKAQENVLKRLHNNLEQMSPADKEKFSDYLEKISGSQELRLRALEKLQKQKTSNELKAIIEQNKTRVRERVENIKQDAEQLKKRIQEKIQQQSQGQTKEQVREQACVTIWDPVCGKDGKTYSNACFAKLAGVGIDYKGKCKTAESFKRQFRPGIQERVQPAE